jgi:hypothetical protein
VAVLGTAVAIAALRGSDEHPSAASDNQGGVVVDPPPGMDRPVLTDAEFQDRVGVRINTVVTTGGGGLIDVRYQVIDPSKASSLHDAETPPAMIDETTGLVVNQLLMGHNHTGDFTAGHAYYLVFENPGNLIHAGSTVSVLLGSAAVGHVVVGG